ncbi:major intrinsic protein domain-containing protein [Ditylenchus destructor]|uniref:Major intrinsic protein domain-containing protein n=1 Tax=Ditylenchus destructor TaxID=166010 RepID=A0AAD4MZJ6_9BILA|nr:major intrinsic protein domain-containing protein [Ditylenchus destructor]
MEKVSTKLRIKNELGRALVGEFLGTAVLMLVIGCVVAQSVLPRPSMNALINVNVGVGLGIVFGIAICARVSGGHINPAVSLMFLTFGQISALRFVLYALVQTAGAFVGAALAFAVYFDAIKQFDLGERQVYGSRATAQIFASYPNTHVGWFTGVIDQVIATALFCMFIAHITDKRNHYPAWTQPLVIGTVFVMIGTCFAYNAGYPCNPARDFGPRLFTLIAGYGFEVFSYRNYGWFWIPIVGPLIGGVLGGWIYRLAIGIHIPQDEYEAVATTTRELQVLTTVKEPNGTEEA